MYFALVYQLIRLYLNMCLKVQLVQKPIFCIAVDGDHVTHQCPVDDAPVHSPNPSIEDVIAKPFDEMGWVSKHPDSPAERKRLYIDYVITEV